MSVSSIVIIVVRYGYRSSILVRNRSLSNVVIALLTYGPPKDRLEDMFGEVVEVGRTSFEYTSAHGRSDMPIYVCRKPRRPIPEVWEEWRLFL